MRDVAWVRSYAEAVAMFEKSVPWRNGGEDRPLPNKRQRTYGVRMSGDDVVFRYHTTDVIRWRPDESYTINTGGYSSRSTCEFASHFMPPRHWLTKETAHLSIDGTVYAVAGQRISVSGTGMVSGPGLGRFEKPSINRKKAKEFLTEVGYYPYVAWHKLMHPMVQDTMPERWRRRYVYEYDIAPMLHDEEKWHDLMMSTAGDPPVLRELLYRYRGAEFGVFDHAYYDSLPSDTNLQRYAVVMRGA
jgi:hypothetical protein